MEPLFFLFSLAFRFCLFKTAPLTLGHFVITGAVFYTYRSVI